jgi:hypothetical protein
VPGCGLYRGAPDTATTPIPLGHVGLNGPICRFFSGSLLPFSQWGGGRQGEHVGQAPGAVRVSSGLLREVSQTQAAVEARYKLPVWIPVPRAAGVCWAAVCDVCAVVCQRNLLSSAVESASAKVQHRMACVRRVAVHAGAEK